MSRTSFRSSRGSFNGRKKFDSIIEGHMEKLSSKKKWQKRYFVLNECSLVYYPNNKKVPGNVREVMALENVSKVEMIETGTTSVKHYEVQITCGNNFPYPLRTSKRQEADLWLDALLDTLQENKSQRNSQNGAKDQQDLMMQVAMAMNMGLQMGMQNNNDQMAMLTQSIHQSTLDGRQAMLNQIQQQSKPLSPVGAIVEEEEEGATGFASAIVNDAMDEVDNAISAGSAKTQEAVDKAIRDANALACIDEDDDDACAAPTPSELAHDAGADLTASFANFYDNVFGNMDGDGDDLDDSDPFGEQETEQTRSTKHAMQKRPEIAVVAAP